MSEHVKVFQLCECDSVAALTLDEAIKWYKEQTGLSDDELYEYDAIEEVSLNKRVYEDERLEETTTVGAIVEENWKGTPFIVTSQY